MLNGKTIVFTGTLSITRAEAIVLAVKAGAYISDTVNSSTDYLVCGTEPGAKLVKAERLRIVVLSGDDFIYYTRGNSSKNPKKIEKKILRPIKKVEIRAPAEFPELDLD